MSTTPPRERVSVPRATPDDYTREAAEARRDFLRERTGASLEHVGSFSLDPAELPGNIEHFTGVAQVPIGVAGPLLVDGEHAQGEFYVPMATAEGTLVASYNRGMKLLHEVGGVKTTVMADRMQRAPAFLFESAREAREFGEWLDEHFDEIREVAEATTKSGKLQDIEQYSASRILYTRFNYTTGDAAGQNLTGKATTAACAWIVANYPEIQQFFLESNFATDKKSSQVNMLRTRGKRQRGREQRGGARRIACRQIGSGSVASGCPAPHCAACSPASRSLRFWRRRRRRPPAATSGLRRSGRSTSPTKAARTSFPLTPCTPSRRRCAQAPT